MVAAQYAGYGARAVEVAVDLADDASIVAAVERCAAELGGLDIPVNNAGALERGATLSPDLATWDGVLAINLRAAIRASSTPRWSAGGSTAPS